MCGIAGLISLDPRRTIDPALLDLMTDSLSHRGPDGRGVWTGEGAGLGHRRLAIIDPEGGSQPWVIEDGNVVFVYNGELYNYRALRYELESAGVSFRSECDTEVALHALLYWGTEQALDKFRGMFAFALWESTPRRLTIARDPLGIKPLYWAMREGIVRFGSEIKAILCDRSFPRYPDPTVIMNYLAHYRLNFRGRTFFKQVNEVPPGSLIRWEGKRRRQVRYWRLPMIPEAEKRDDGPDKTIEGFRELLAQAVERRMIADVPVGAYLSGGIDSSVLVHLMRTLRNDRIHTYSIGFPEKDYNEFSFSAMMARHIGVDHKQVTLTERGYFNQLESLIAVKDTPLSVPNEVPLRFLSRVLKNKITVVLSGEGADELMGGYTQLVRSPHDFLLAQALEEKRGDIPAEDRHRLESSLKNLYGQCRFPSQRHQFLTLYQWMPESERSWLSGIGLAQSDAEANIAAFWKETWSKLDSSGLDPYEKVLHILEEVHLAGLLLRLDATTMAEGVEGRVPYTDRDLVEWVSAQPVNYKVRWKGKQEQQAASLLTAVEVAGTYDQTKYLLRLAYAGEIPDQIVQRPKAAFPVPLDNWFFGTWRNWALERILTPRMGVLFNLERLEHLVNSSRSKDEGMKIWMLANLGIWLETYFS